MPDMCRNRPTAYVERHPTRPGEWSGWCWRAGHIRELGHHAQCRTLIGRLRSDGYKTLLLPGRAR